MPSVVILGANGFLGKTLLRSADLFGSVKAIVRSIPNNVDVYQKTVTWIEADLMNPSSFIDVLSEGDIVINLAYIQDNDKLKNITLMNNIIEVCIRSKVSRLLHCSTAVVVGDTKINHINELSPCNPSTPYEQTKLALEDCVLSASLRGLDVGILRPTAIIGSGGKNLLKLVYSLKYGNKFSNYFKTCVLGNMPMHLVPVRNVVEALLCLSLSHKQLDGDIFIVSADEDIDNNFQKVEEILLDELGLNRVFIPYLTLPRVLQSLLFKLINRNDINMNRTYDSKKLNDYGFEPVDSVNEAIHQFSHSIKVDNFVNLASNKDID
jgi:nucleoside-diphosphate-sugar epimerase